MKISGLAAVAAMLFGAGAQAGGNVSFTFGTRVLDDDYRPFNRQAMIGLLGDVQFGPSPVHLEWGLRASSKQEEETGVEVTGAVVDLSLGALLRPTTGAIRPYFSAGVASVGFGVEAEQRIGTTTVRQNDDDQSFGYYAATGVLVQTGRTFTLGFDARYLGGTKFRFDGDPEEFDADSYTVGLRAGWAWGGTAAAPAASVASSTASPAFAPGATTPTTATLPQAETARIAGVLARCNDFLAANGYRGACTLADAPAGYPQLGVPLPTPADSNRHNATVSSQLVDPFCAALRENGRTGTVLVSASSINYATRYDCGLRSWSPWLPR